MQPGPGFGVLIAVLACGPLRVEAMPTGAAFEGWRAISSTPRAEVLRADSLGAAVPPDSVPGVARDVERILPTVLSQQPRAVTVADVSGFERGPRYVDRDYAGGGIAFDLAHLVRFAGRFAAGPRIGYAYAHGVPRERFTTVTAVDSTTHVPRRAWVQIFDVALHAGQVFYSPTGRVLIFYAAGPGLFRVSESADIDETTVRRVGGAPLSTGTRNESLARWAAGGDVVAGAVWRVGRRDRVGLALRGFGVSWKPRGRQPLALDDPDRHALYGFDLGAALSHDWW